MTPTMTMAGLNSTMNSAMNYPQFQSQQPQVQPQAPPQIQLPTNQEHYLNGEAAMSPSRSLSSASPPTSMMNGGVPPQSATPTPEEEKNPEYLKELQAEKDSLESSYAAIMA